jgi:hypothetical protein
MLAELGDHLYRIRRRLETAITGAAGGDHRRQAAADDKSLLSECGAVYPLRRPQQQDGVHCFSLMWARKLRLGIGRPSSRTDCYSTRLRR